MTEDTALWFSDTSGRTDGLGRTVPHPLSNKNGTYEVLLIAASVDDIKISRCPFPLEAHAASAKATE